MSKPVELKKEELFKVVLIELWDMLGEYPVTHYFRSLEEAKALVDEIRDSCSGAEHHTYYLRSCKFEIPNYSLIMRCEGVYVDEHNAQKVKNLGNWGDYSEEK